MTLSRKLVERKCDVCERIYLPARPMQAVCSPRCAARKVKLQRLKEQAAERETDRKRKEALKTAKELIPEAQKAFNDFIRARDRHRPCISCRKPLPPQKPGGSYDAGHFRSRGAAPNLRFHEDNCHAQCKGCNQPGGCTYGEYREGLVERIGEERVSALEGDNAPRKYTLDELREIIRVYRARRKELEQKEDI